MKTTRVLLFISCNLLLQCITARSKYNEEGEDNPYEFQFRVDGQQHRHEKKDANGIIQGEFGFITADGIYHVTVYATDEDGSFKILSMKNIRVSGPLDEPNAQLPDTSQFGKDIPKPAVPALPAPNPLSIEAPAPPVQTITSRPNEFTTQATIKPACAGCGYVTQQTPHGTNGNNKLPFQTSAFENPKPGTVVIGTGLPNGNLNLNGNNGFNGNNYPSSPPNYPGNNQDRFPGSNQDRFPGSNQDRFPGSNQDRFPGSNQGRFPGSNQAIDGFNGNPLDKTHTNLQGTQPTTTQIVQNTPNRISDGTLPTHHGKIPNLPTNDHQDNAQSSQSDPVHPDDYQVKLLLANKAIAGDTIENIPVPSAGKIPSAQKTTPGQTSHDTTFKTPSPTSEQIHQGTILKTSLPPGQSSLRPIPRLPSTGQIHYDTILTPTIQLQNSDIGTLNLQPNQNTSPNLPDQAFNADIQNSPTIHSSEGKNQFSNIPISPHTESTYIQHTTDSILTNKQLLSTENYNRNFPINQSPSNVGKIPEETFAAYNRNQERKHLNNNNKFITTHANDGSIKSDPAFNTENQSPNHQTKPSGDNSNQFHPTSVNRFNSANNGNQFHSENIPIITKNRENIEHKYTQTNSDSSGKPYQPTEISLVHSVEYKSKNFGESPTKPSGDNSNQFHPANINSFNTANINPNNGNQFHPESIPSLNKNEQKSNQENKYNPAFNTQQNADSFGRPHQPTEIPLVRVSDYKPTSFGESKIPIDNSLPSLNTPSNIQNVQIITTRPNQVSKTHSFDNSKTIVSTPNIPLNQADYSLGLGNSQTTTSRTIPLAENGQGNQQIPKRTDEQNDSSYYNQNNNNNPNRYDTQSILNEHNIKTHPSEFIESELGSQLTTPNKLPDNTGTVINTSNNQDNSFNDHPAFTSPRPYDNGGIKSSASINNIPATTSRSEYHQEITIKPDAFKNTYQATTSKPNTYEHNISNTKSSNNQQTIVINAFNNDEHNSNAFKTDLQTFTSRSNQANTQSIATNTPITNPPTGGAEPNPLSLPNSVTDRPPNGISVDKGFIMVPNNPPIPIKDKYPNMVDGLPDGIGKDDITGILYKFNYTVGFHGHYEKGYKSGAKVGGYFVTDRDGVSRIVTYVADENGYRPKVKLVRLDLNSELVPKEGTEKTFGLKSFEFVWYPLN